VGTPFEGKSCDDPCDCQGAAEGDGIDDLSIKFNVPEVSILLNGLAPGAFVELVVSGKLVDGTPFTSAGDCVRLVPPGDIDADNDVDGVDFLTFSVCYNGSLNPPRPDCVSLEADIDGDGDCDGVDFLTFVTCFSGPNKPSKCR
jgi:hypothetical protein